MSSYLERWMHELGQPTQYKNVAYVRSDDHYVWCLMCNTGGMHHKVASKHFQGSHHLARFNQVKALKDKHEEVRRRYKDCYVRSLQQRVDHLGLAKWKDTVKVLLYDFSYGDIFQAGLEAEQVLAKYEKMERLSLLELAIWKCKICDGVTFSSIQEMREYKILEEGFDPTQFAQELRLVSGSPVIIPLVASFLW